MEDKEITIDLDASTVSVDGSTVLSGDVVQGFKVRLTHPFLWEGELYREVDLSGLESLSTRKLKKIYKASVGPGEVPTILATDMTYCINCAAEATGLPVEFFDDLPAVDGTRIQLRVMTFLLTGA